MQEEKLRAAARDLAEDRAKVLSEQKQKDESRIRILERRVSELLVQRVEMEKEMEVTRSAMKRVEENVNTLCSVRSRVRTGNDG